MNGGRRRQGGLLGGVLPGPGQPADRGDHAGEAARARDEGAAEDCARRALTRAPQAGALVVAGQRRRRTRLVDEEGGESVSDHQDRKTRPPPPAPEHLWIKDDGCDPGQRRENEHHHGDGPEHAASFAPHGGERNPFTRSRAGIGPGLPRAGTCLSVQRCAALVTA